MSSEAIIGMRTQDSGQAYAPLNVKPIDAIICKIQSQKPLLAHEVETLSNTLISEQDISKKRAYASCLHTLSTSQYCTNLEMPKLLLSHLPIWGDALNARDLVVAETTAQTLQNVSRRCHNILSSSAADIAKLLAQGWQRSEIREFIAPTILQFKEHLSLSSIIMEILRNSIPKGIISQETSDALSALATQAILQGKYLTDNDAKTLFLSNLDILLTNSISAHISLSLLKSLIIRDIVTSNDDPIYKFSTIFLSHLNNLLINRESAPKALSLLEKLIKENIIILSGNDELIQRLTNISVSTHISHIDRKGLYKILGTQDLDTFVVVDSASNAISNLSQSHPQFLSESISCLATAIATNKYHLSSEAARAVELALDKIDTINKMDDIHNACYILTQATYEQKKLVKLEPNTIKVLCNTLTAQDTTPALKLYICRSLEFLMCKNFGAVLKDNANLVIESLTHVLSTITSDNISMISSAVACFRAIAANVTQIQTTRNIELDPRKFDALVDTMSLKLKILYDNMPATFDIIIESLQQIIKNQPLSTDSLANLITHSSSVSALDSIRKAKILETVRCYASKQEGASPTAPANLLKLLPNLDSNDSEIVYCTLKVLNLFALNDELLLGMKSLTLENIIVHAASQQTSPETLSTTPATQKQVFDAFELIKSEACKLLSSFLVKGYTPLPADDTSIPTYLTVINILQHQLSFNTAGELYLLKTCIEIGTIDELESTPKTPLTDEASTADDVAEMSDVASNLSQDSGIEVTDHLIHGIATIARSSLNNETIIAAIRTLVTAACYPTDEERTLDTAYVLDCLDEVLRRAKESNNEIMGDIAASAIARLEERFTEDCLIDDPIDEIVYSSRSHSSLASDDLSESEIHGDEVEAAPIKRETQNIDTDIVGQTEPLNNTVYNPISESESDSDVDVKTILETQTQTPNVDTVAVPHIRTDNTLLAELSKVNPGTSINVINLQHSLDKINKCYIEFAKSPDIKTWAAQAKAKPTSVEEIIAVAKYAIKQTKGHELRTTQIISALMLLEPQNKGRLAQIATGEGKSTTIAVLAIVRALQGKKVDIITSSPLLATRDAADKATLFEMFGLSSGHNIDSKYRDGLKPAYEKDIMYGDAITFEHDFLKHEYKSANTRGDRFFKDSVAIVDEVDSMLLDESGNIAKIAGHTPGMEYLIPLLALVWKEANYPQNDPTIIGQKKFIENITAQSEKDLLTLTLPKHLMPFAKSQVSAWAASAARALESEEDVDYVIALDKEKGQNIIAPVDHANTGIVRAKTAWVDGLHQFLQMKHHLAITSENLTTAFISNLSFFKSYETNIYGLTGTLGSSEAQNLLCTEYNVDTVKVPTYKESQFKPYPGLVTANDKEWMQAIVASTVTELQNGRALLIICDTIRAAKQIHNILSQVVGKERIREYYRSDDDTQAANIEHITSGQIIVATNLAGRGTDIHTSEELEENGGLHVCVTFLPKNQRIEDQAFGRTARQGNKGTAELILDAEKERKKLKEGFGKNRAHTIADFKISRNAQETAELKEVTEKRIPKLNAEDALFKEFAILKKDLAQIDASEYLQQNLEEQWGLWLKSHSLEKIDIFDEAKIKAEFAEFKTSAKASYKNPKNPTYLARHAWNIMVSNYGASFQFYKQAIAQDEAYSFIPAYNMGYALVRANSRGKHYNDNVPGDVSAYLGRAFDNINKVHIPQTLKLREILKPEENSPLALQIEAKLDLLAYQKAYIEPAIATSRGISGGKHITVAGYKQIREVFPTQGNSADPIYEAAISEVNAAGLHIFYDLGAKLPPPRGDAAFSMIVSLGVAAFATPFIGPGAFAWAGTFGSASLGAASIAVTSRFAGGIVTNRGRIDKAFADVTSKDSLKNIGLDALSAGVCAHVTKSFGLVGKAKGGLGPQSVRIVQQHAIKGLVHSIVTQENLGKAMKREAISAAQDMTFNTAAYASDKAGIAPNSFVRTLVDGSTAGGIAVLQGGKFEIGLAVGMVGNIAGRYAADAHEGSHRPDLSGVGGAIVSGAMTNWDTGKMSLYSGIAASGAQYGHISRYVKVPDSHREALGVAAGDVVEDDEEAEEVSAFDPRGGTMIDAKVDNSTPPTQIAIQSLSDIELRDKFDSLTGFQRGLFKNTQSDYTKGLMLEYNRRFDPGADARNSQVTQNALDVAHVIPIPFCRGVSMIADFASGTGPLGPLLPGQRTLPGNRFQNVGIQGIARKDGVGGSSKPLINVTPKSTLASSVPTVIGSAQSTNVVLRPTIYSNVSVSGVGGSSKPLINVTPKSTIASSVPTVIGSAQSKNLSQATQKSSKVTDLKPKAEPHPSYLDKQIKGQRAEVAAHITLKRAGYEILESKLPGNKGIDAVAIKTNAKGEVIDIILVESKYRTSGTPKLDPQMYDGWINSNIKKMQDSLDPAVQKTGELLDKNRDLIRRKANLMDPSGSNRWNQIKLPPTEMFKE